MDHLITAFILYFTSFFTIINPIGSMPVFLTMTASLNQRARNRTALKAVLTAFITLMIFALGGQLLFNFFGNIRELFIPMLQVTLITLHLLEIGLIIHG